MSDLTASGCGCGSANNCGCGSSGSICGNWIWILILLFCCGGNNSLRSGCDDSCDNGCGNWIWILILLFCCCGNNGRCC